MENTEKSRGLIIPSIPNNTSIPNMSNTPNMPINTITLSIPNNTIYRSRFRCLTHELRHKKKSYKILIVH